MTPDYLAFAIQNARAEFGLPTDPAPVPVVPLGPRHCCAKFASVTACDGETDTWRCPVCAQVWDAPCR